MRNPIIPLSLIALLLLPATLHAATLYLKSGEEMECESYRQRGDRIVVRFNADSEIDVVADEVDFGKTPKPKAEPTAKAKPTAPAAAAEPPSDSTWWKAGEVPAAYTPGTPQLRNELATIFARYNHAAESGDFEAMAKQMPAFQAKMTRTELSKVKDKKELQKRRKVMQGMAVRDFVPEQCAVSPDGSVAALAGKGKELRDGKYREAQGTVKFVKENGSWKVAFQIW